MSAYLPIRAEKKCAGANDVPGLAAGELKSNRGPEVA